jgi:lysophospholipase L1-like esterase
MMRVGLLLVALLSGTARGQQAATLRGPEGLLFRKGDRVVFLGDSITAQSQYTLAVELYLATHFPARDMLFLNAGLSSDTATGGAARFAAHVLAEKPTAVVINFGMNDMGYAFVPSRQAGYLKHTEAMLDAAARAGVRVLLLSPNAVDWRLGGRLKEMLDTQKPFYAPLRELAARHGAAFVDLYAFTRQVLEKIDADGSVKLRPFTDGIHPAPPGALLMAYAVLTGIDAPALVSAAVIDVVPATARTHACRVEGLHASPTAVSFDREDDALPMPVLPEWQPILPFVGGLERLNQYTLRVRGLRAGSYTLSIDGREVGTYSAEQLTGGVNLANLSTGPLYEQGLRVYRAAQAKNQLVRQRFGQVMAYTAPEWLADVAVERRPAELRKRLGPILEHQAEVYRLAQPTRHHFELKPAG